jgi:hypothetical protein
MPGTQERFDLWESRFINSSSSGQVIEIRDFRALHEGRPEYVNVCVFTFFPKSLLIMFRQVLCQRTILCTATMPVTSATPR